VAVRGIVQDFASTTHLNPTAGQQALSQESASSLNARLHAGKRNPSPPSSLLLSGPIQVGHDQGIPVRLRQAADHRRQTLGQLAKLFQGVLLDRGRRLVHPFVEGFLLPPPAPIVIHDAVPGDLEDPAGEASPLVEPLEIPMDP
jgi:hypothetical protein